MERFMHASVRLNTDLGRAYRLFIKPDQLTRWFCQGAALSPDGETLSLTGVQNPEDSWNWSIQESQREKMIRILCTDYFTPSLDKTLQLEIQMMKCTSLTEYCSEVHILLKGFEASDAGDALRSAYMDLWTAKMEALRSLINGKWFIEDKDLSLDIFK